MTHIMLLAPTTFRARVSDFYQTDVTTEEGGCTEQGAHMADGMLFTGMYSYKKWIHESISSYHEAIHASIGTTKKKRDSPFQKHHQTKKRKASKLRSTIVELIVNKARLMSEISAFNNGSSGGGSLGRSTYLYPTQVGRQFGACSEKIDDKKK